MARTLRTAPSGRGCNKPHAARRFALAIIRFDRTAGTMGIHLDTRAPLAGEIEMRIPLFLMLILIAVPLLVQAQDDSAEIRSLKSEVSSLESKVRNLESEMKSITAKLDDAAIVLFFFAVFCAWWAQYTDRNPWLWFFLGLFFHVFTAFVLLIKNAGDKRMKDASWRTS
jgi:hypothetical protein